MLEFASLKVAAPGSSRLVWITVTHKYFSRMLMDVIKSKSKEDELEDENEEDRREHEEIV